MNAQKIFSSVMLVLQKRLPRLTCIVGLYLLCSLPLLVTDFNAEEFRDWRAYLAAGSGQIVYRDFAWLYGPLGPYLFGLLLRLFGNPVELIGLRLVFIFTGVLALLIGDAVLNKVLRPPWSLLGTLFMIPAFLPPQYTYNNALLIPLGLAALNFFLDPSPHSKNPLFSWPGVGLCAAAVLIRPLDAGPGLILAITGYCLLTEARPLQRIGIFLLQVALPLLALYGLLYALLAGQHVPFWEKILIPFYGQANATYHQVWAFDFSWLRALWPLTLHGGFVAFLGLLDFIKRLTLLVFLLSGWFWWRNQNQPRAYGLFYLTALLFSARILFSDVFYPYLAAFVFIALTYFIFWVSERFPPWARRSLGAWLLILFCLQLPLRDYYDLFWIHFFPRTYPRRSAFLHRVLPRFAYRTPALKHILAGQQKKAELVDQTVSAILSATQENEAIFFFGYDPTYYALSQRPSIFPEDEYIVFSAGLNYPPKPENQFINLVSKKTWTERIRARLESRKPKLVLLASDNFAPGITDQNPAYAFIREHYAPWAFYEYDFSYRDFDGRDKMVSHQYWIKLLRWEERPHHAGEKKQDL